MLMIVDYNLKEEPEQVLDLPIGFESLGMSMKQGVLVFTALVDVEANTTPVEFLTCHTGDCMTDYPGHYLGWYRIDDSMLINYVFYR